MFEGLDAIAWAELEHHYGPASDVPDLLRRCVDPDPDVAMVAIDRLDMSLFHQGGSIPSAVTAALPYLVSLAVSGTAIRISAVQLVTDLAEEATGLQPRWLDPGWPDALASASTDLLALLDDTDPSMRRAAARLVAVGGFDPQRALGALVRRWRVEADPAARLDVILALGHLASQVPSDAAEALGLLQLLVKSDDRQTQLATLLALKHIDPETGRAKLGSLIAAVTDPSVTRWQDSAWIGGGTAPVVREASELLAGDAPLQAEFTAAVSTGGAAGQQVAGLGVVAELLGRIRTFDAQFLPVLAPHLTSAQPEARFAAAYLLGCLGATAAAHADDLATLLDDADQYNRTNTVADATLWALARLRDRRCVPRLRQRLTAGRLGYASSTGYYPRGTNFVLPGIHEVIAHSGAAHELMSAIIDRLHRAHDTGDLELVNVLCHTLNADAEPAAALLREILRHSGERRVPEFAVLQAIGRLGPTAHASADELARRAGSGSADAALALWQVTGQLEPTLTILTQTRAVLHLGVMGSAAAPSEPIIREHLTSTNDWTRTHAAHAIWHVTGDAGTAVRVLTDVARPLAAGQHLPVRATAVRHLLDMGHPTTEVIAIARAILATPKRLSSSGGWRCFTDDEDIRATAGRLAQLEV